MPSPARNRAITVRGSGPLSRDPSAGPARGPGPSLVPGPARGACPAQGLGPRAQPWAMARPCSSVTFRHHRVPGWAAAARARSRAAAGSRGPNGPASPEEVPSPSRVATVIVRFTRAAIRFPRRFFCCLGLVPGPPGPPGPRGRGGGRTVLARAGAVRAGAALVRAALAGAGPGVAAGDLVDQGGGAQVVQRPV